MLWIARHELHRHLAGIAFWLKLATVQVLVAWLFFAQVDVYTKIAPQLGATGTGLDAFDLVVAPTLSTLLLVELVLAPLLTMNSLAGELRAGRLSHWLGHAGSSHRVIVGKLLGNWAALSLITLSLVLTVASLGLAIDLDLPRLASGILALLLAGALATGAGLLCSSLTRQPPLAFAAALGLLLLLWLLDSLLGAKPPWIALLPHFTPLLDGLVRTGDLAYFALLTLAAAWIASFRLATRRGEF